MIDKLSSALHFQQEVLHLRHQRQQVLAANIANADTPGYKARDFDFADTLTSVLGKGRGQGQLSMTRTSDLHAVSSTRHEALPPLGYRHAAQASLDGNTVEMDQERARFLDNAVRYQASLIFMENYLQQIKTAMQPE